MGPRRYILSKARETRFFLETKKDEETHRAATHVTPPTSTCSDRSHRLRFFRSRPPRTTTESALISLLARHSLRPSILLMPCARAEALRGAHRILTACVVV